MEIRDRKAAQRRAGIMARKGLPQAERAAANAAICARLLAMPCFQKAENLLLYAAFGGEVDLAGLAEQAARLGKTVAYPVCGENFTLTAAVPGPDGWEVGAYGIRTPVPEREQLESFASHQTSMAIYLSVQRIHRVAERLIEGGYPATTPVAVIYKATWPESQTVRGTLADIGDKVRDAGIRKTALILVGNFLGSEYHYSKLYAADFSHEYRKA